MELYERLNLLAGKTGTKTKLASALGIPQQKMSLWGNKLSQRNFWEYLPNLLKAMPEVSREWLYFEEGEMFKRDNPNIQSEENIKSSALQETIRQQSETIHQQAETIRKLTDELLSIRRTA